jgi:hypothetical protein
MKIAILGWSSLTGRNDGTGSGGRRHAGHFSLNDSAQTITE